ncbi:MAG TPA: fumarylacetoacetase [Saprospiraceae bacterium]|nr:fumarylacetoacetase [Saprospiraceae bacterium]
MKELQSWLRIPESSDFSIHNIPFGIFSTNRFGPRIGVAIGDQVLDLVGLAQKGLIEVPIPILTKPHLNDFIRLGKRRTSAIRQSLQRLLSDVDSPLKDFPELLLPQKQVQMHLPIEVGDYTDFYSSKEHATNVGAMFRDPENALLPNWKHLPVGYHGRASSIIASGQSIHRPYGQTMPRGAETPVFGPSRRLDFELEMAFVIGKDSQLGQRISTTEADDYIFGMVLFNDWSARDIQKWEYAPLGPFLGKSFASSISPWIVTLDALADFRLSGPQQDPTVLPYLQFEGSRNYDIQLEVDLQPKDSEATSICRSNTKHLYWNIAQQLAHHTVNGCNIRIGDLMASGTISGPEPGNYGSMLELSWGGKKNIELKGGQKRTFIEDYDTVTMRAFAKKPGKRIGFGEVSNQILPAIEP